MNGEIDPLGVVFMVAWLALIWFAVRKLFRRPRRTAWDRVLLIAGVLLAFAVFLGGELLYAFVRISLPF